MLEIELKVRVSSIDPLRQKLVDPNAQSCGRSMNMISTIMHPIAILAVTDEAIRVRYTDDHAVITYKGAKIKASGLKAREELSTAVESGEVFEQILDRLGFLKTAEVNKWRENFRYRNAAISLDSVDELGNLCRD